MKRQSQKTIQPRPFVKWAGGKTRLVDQILEYFPDNFNDYYEPFLGGGSLYFSISPQSGRLNDSNATLIFAYTTLRDNCALLIKGLSALQEEYYALEHLEEKESFYYERRAEFNAIKGHTVRKAALFIFLNKTGFNGMYRENNKGEYNIPFGKHSNPLICDVDNLKRVSGVLGQIDITHSQYEDAIKEAKSGDFIYLDPPYAPLTSTSFTQYQAGGFRDEDQIHLRDIFVDLDKKGCFVMMSNSTAPIIEKLYKDDFDFYLNKITAARMINSRAEERGKIDEYIVTNYDPNRGEYARRRRSPLGLQD